MRGGFPALVLTLILAVLLPFVFANILATALLKLQLDPRVAVGLALGMIFGGALNIPIKRIPRAELVTADPFAAFGLAGLWPRMVWRRRETVIAVNVGGCLIPSGIAVYEAIRLLAGRSDALFALVVAVLLNVVVCFRMAKPIPGIGIRMRPIFPAITAALSASVLLPDAAPSLAVIAGVAGPLIGADLLHIREFAKETTGMASIGGAGTFDGIVFSAVLAVYLA
jgi:uncharacterized membrane protein